MMKLKKFRVSDFRSVDDSGWIETDDVIALIGENESGKTNILLPLWKLNPAKEGGIIPTADYPRKNYSTFRNQTPKPIFIRAVFEVDDNLSQQLSQITSMPVDMMQEVEVARRFDGDYEVDFPNVELPRSIDSKQILTILEDAERELEIIIAMKTEVDLKMLLISSIQSTREFISTISELDVKDLENILAKLEDAKTMSSPKTSEIVPRYHRVINDISEIRKEISRAHPSEIKDAIDLVIKNIPKFVYYSTYGNLDSEIYLPHVIANLERDDLGTKELAKARTLKVLFEFVDLEPNEILELGRDFKTTNHSPTEDEIAVITEKKRQRSILLQSASTKLTTQFRDWWKQGEYRFRFEADGDHFRIWVSDEKRPEEIELEGRSTGLQWFLSFYLVFLVEQADAHEGAILLLDEPGLSLHPLAQRDLSIFFDDLAKDNQLIYTSHSPFLIDADRLDRARKVFISANGTSKVSSDLRASDDDVKQRGAAYAVYAALGLSVAESLLLGCEPIVVEGVSDQHYLTSIKNLLIAEGYFRPSRELVFPPAGGAKGVKAVSSILGGRDEKLPIVLVDSDVQGRAMAETLRKGLYQDNPNLVLEINSFTSMSNSEVEDLIPQDIIVHSLDRWLRSSEVQFANFVNTGYPIVPQIEDWAKKNNLNLQVPGWKVELAKRVKHQLLSNGLKSISKDFIDIWIKLFDTFQSARTQS